MGGQAVTSTHPPIRPPPAECPSPQSKPVMPRLKEDPNPRATPDTGALSSPGPWLSLSKGESFLGDSGQCKTGVMEGRIYRNRQTQVLLLP